MAFKDSSSKSAYGAQSIRVMEGLEAVRKRPAMYIGSTGVQGLHHLVYEVVDNSVDEALAGFCNTIKVMLHEDGSCSVEDNGRGIPTDIHPTEKVSAAEVVLTKLHAGGKFDKESYKFSGGLHGVGVSVVNALSKSLELIIWRDGSTYEQHYERGNPVDKLVVTGPSTKRGTYVRFLPDPEIFTETVDFNFETLSARFRELAFLNKGLQISIIDERFGKKNIFLFEGGIVSFVEYINKKKTPLFDTVISLEQEDEMYQLALAMQYNDGYGEQIFSFVNNINTVDGGTHVTGFKSALTKVCNKRALAMNVLKDGSDGFSSEDVREGLVSVISLKVPEPQFEGQTKAKLGNSEVKGIVESWVSTFLDTYFEEHPAIARAIFQKAEIAKRAREAAKKARDLTRRKNVLESSVLPGKLADCSNEDPAACELFIVEGDSAGGSAKSARDRNNQAILPLRGKILNVEKARLDKILSNEEIRALVAAIGGGIGSDFDVSKLRYHKIILMTDADVDGSHICTLLLTFFFRYMVSLIEKGHLYIAQPPLYKAKIGKTEQYLRDDKALQQFLFTWARAQTMLSIGDVTQTTEAWHEILDTLLAYDRELSIVSTHQIIAYAQCHQLVLALQKNEALKTDNPARLIELLKTVFPEYEVGVQALSPDVVDDVEVVTDQIQETAVPSVDYIIFSMPSNTWQVPIAFFTSKEVEHLLKALVPLLSFEQHMWTLQVIEKDRSITGKGIVPLLEAVRAIGKPYMTIQRYKGLGEMNPDQLGETAMDPALRSLLQVTIEDALAADTWFSTLMGDDVSGRREYIAMYGQFVKNLDI
jgi:DNA gyrase subunit B